MSKPLDLHRPIREIATGLPVEILKTDLIVTGFSQPAILYSVLKPRGYFVDSCDTHGRKLSLWQQEPVLENIPDDIKLRAARIKNVAMYVIGFNPGSSPIAGVARQVLEDVREMERTEQWAPQGGG